MLDILLVDDEPDLRQALGDPLIEAGHRVTEARDGSEALAMLTRQTFDLAICDIRLPKIDGLTLLRHIHRECPATAVVLMTAYANVADAVAALRGGAFDYVTKPFDIGEFPARVIARIAERRELKLELERAREQLDGLQALIGRSPGMVRLLESVETIALSDAPVLITGESGTGKELVARLLHQRSPRASAPFVAVNCAALPETLLEAELFGHERGAFTGAIRKREGRFALAHGGTLLLDEIGEIPLAAQAKLLRVLQEGAYEPLGGSAPVHVDVRVVSATHVDLKQRMAEGRFRADLYYRLNVLDLAIPPLRDRVGDLPLLLQHFLQTYTPDGKEPPPISPRAWAALLRYPFPGNVREFSHLVERAVVLSRGREIDLEHLPPELVQAPIPTSTGSGEFQPLATAIKEFEREHLLRALELTGGKKALAAGLLGISRKNLWEKLRAHGLADTRARHSGDGPPADHTDSEPTGEFDAVRPKSR